MSIYSDSLTSLLAAAVEIADDGAREKFIECSCGNDTLRMAELRGLVRDYFAACDLLDVPLRAVSALSDSAVSLAGDCVGPYTLRELLGEGGMGSVYLAEQQAPVRRQVALKIVKPGMDSRDVLARFEMERQALALMDHPHIARVLDAGITTQGRPFFVMELVRGAPITEYCAEQRLTISERLELFQQVCRAVQHAHLKGIIHRDIKPSNVIVARHDGLPIAKVIDFGVAKAVNPQLLEGTLHTGALHLVGTPPYMSPEQAGCNGLDVDSRSDVYALGALLYEMLTGSVPFGRHAWRQAGFDELRRMICQLEPVRPSKLVVQGACELLSIDRLSASERRQWGRKLRGELDCVVLKALEKNRNRRYMTANAMALDITRYLAHQPVEARPPSTAYLAAKFARRHVVLLVALACIGLTLVAAAIVSQRQAQEADAARQALADRETRLRRQLYASDIGRAWAAWSEGSAEVAQAILQRHDPRALPAGLTDDCREFAWRYLADRCNRRGELLGAHPAPLLAAAVAPGDRPLAASTDRAGNIRIWNLAKGTAAASWRHGNQEITTVAFSPEVDLLATAGQDRTIRLWNIGDGNQVACLRGHTLTVSSIAWSPDGRYLASAGRDGSVRIWDVAARQEVRRPWESDEVAHCVAWSPDGRQLAAAVGSGVKLWWTDDWSVQVSAPSLSRPVLAVAFSQTGKWLAYGGYGGSVLVCDPASGNELMRASASSVTVWSLAFSPDEKYLLAGLSDGGPNVWSIRTTDRRLELMRTAFEHEGSQRAVLFTEEGRSLLTACEDSATLVRWNFTEQLGVQLAEYPGACLVTIPSPLRLVMALDDGSISLRQVATGEETQILSGHRHPATRAAVEETGGMLATSSPNGPVFVWDLKSGKAIGRLPTSLPSIDDLAFAPRQRLLAVASELEGIELWDAVAGERLQEFRPAAGGVHAVAFSGDGTLLAASAISRPEAYVWDVRRGTLLATLTADQPLFRVRFTPDGARLLAGGRTSRTWIWDVRSRQPVGQLLGHRGGVVDLAISHDAQTLATLGTDQTIRLWHLPTGDELFAALPGYAPAWLQFASSRELVIGMGADAPRTSSVCILDAP